MTIEREIKMPIKKMKIKKYDFVEWMCRPYGMREFLCVGQVLGFKQSTFGGCKGGKGAFISVKTPKYKKLFNKSKTFVSIKNLSLA